MSTIITRAGKGSPLTSTEVDSNFTNLNTDKVEKAGTDPISITANSASDALRITQTGTGNALLVEDSANPDSTPFVIDSSGNVGVGVTTTSGYKLSVYSNAASHGVARLEQANASYNTDLELVNAANTTSISLLSKRTNGDLWLYQSGANNIAGLTAGVERFRIAAAGTISLGAAPGAESLRVTPVASAVNYLFVGGSTTGDSPFVRFQGSDTNIGGFYDTTGNGSHTFRTNVYGGAPTQFLVAHTASAVNYLQVTGAATGGGVVFSSQGTDANVNMNYLAKGNAAHIFATSGYTPQFVVAHTASAVNYLEATGNVTGSSPYISAKGSDTNIDLALVPKGTGVVKFGAHTGSSDVAITGYITIKDANGNTRKLAVIS
jgi:hypothetical protein